MKYRICAVIVNYKTADMTFDCVRTLAPQLDAARDRIVVVDNASGGTDLERLLAYFGEAAFGGMVSLIPLPGNDGFSAGNNAGIISQEAEYYLLTNSDTLFHDGAIAALLSAAERFPEAGLVSPRLEWPDGKPQCSCFRHHSPLSETINSANTGLITWFLRSFNVPLLPVLRKTSPQWTSFACVLVKKVVVDTIGLLDDGFFMYYEDADYCRRARNVGFDIVNWPDARVIHLQGKSSDMDDRARAHKSLPAYYYHSRSRYYRKFYGSWGLLAANICWLCGRFVSIVRETFQDINPAVPDREFYNIWKQRTR